MNSTVRYKQLILLCVPLLFMISCGVVSQTAERPSVTPDYPSESAPEMERVMAQLYSAHEEWKGTPYVLGGSGMNGIDCSALMQVVFSEYFGEDLPRNTREQMGEGNGVRRQNIRPGDLIFFRTGRGVLHVGVAMEDGDFLHASVSAGVTISNLSENYWAGRYIGTRRVL
ncbi:MAG: C40 family peptidase [Balneolaceae bacterium]|nr:C40 family peptidase [Balneolaceae bacterium]MCH8547708.1 NlpC/P60 family protein [Balneolaceae bacterium]